VEGRSNGAPAVDYTINAEVGVPLMTGPQDSAAPVNHVVPAWDLVTGALAASAVTAALLRRSMSGEGSEVGIALADVALACVGNMGWLAEADIASEARQRHGNHMFGSFGVDFETKDHRRVMVVALTEGQWRALVTVTETGDLFEALETLLDADLQLESDRYRLRETIAAVLRPWFAQRMFTEVTALLDSAKVLWSPYLDMAEVADRARSSSGGFARTVDQPGIGAMLSTGSPLRWGAARVAAAPAPGLGADTEQVLTELLGLDTASVGRLAQQGVIGLG
jgi:2-methylfumaryl-CoA isomerase